MRIGQVRRAQHALEIRFGIAEGNVAQNGVAEDMVLLQDQPDFAPHFAVVQGLEVHVIEKDGPVGGFDQAGEELDEGGLA